MASSLKLLTAPGVRVTGPSMGPYTEWKDTAQVRPCYERQAVCVGGESGGDQDYPPWLHVEGRSAVSGTPAPAWEGVLYLSLRQGKPDCCSGVTLSPHSATHLLL